MSLLLLFAICLVVALSIVASINSKPYRYPMRFQADLVYNFTRTQVSSNSGVIFT